jgi:hypothetical protein
VKHTGDRIRYARRVLLLALLEIVAVGAALVVASGRPAEPLLIPIRVRRSTRRGPR